MRDLLEKIDTIIMEKARGLLYRDPGDTFFQGSLQSPSAEIKFRDLEYYPGQPGAYDSYDEMAKVGQELSKQYPQGIIWSNKPGARSRAFAILTFDGPGHGQTTSFGRFFDQIKPDMSGLWKNNELPGNWQLKKATSLKGSYYKLKPSDIFPPESKFSSPAECIAAIGSNPDTASPGQDQAIQEIRPGMQMLLKNQYPVFDNIDENMVSAVRDDLGETIGPIAMIQGMIKNPTLEKARVDILGQGGSFSGSTIYFPASKINGLVDSYLIQPGGVEVGVSSKGESGAKASVKNIADGVERARKKDMTDLLNQYQDQVKIIDRVGSLASRDLPLVLGQENGYIDKSQAAAILKLISSGAKTLDKVDMSSQDREVLQALMDEYRPKTDNPKYNVGYHVLAVLAKKVMADINKDPIFGEACLKFLNTSPIVQLHLKGRGGKNNYAVTGFEVKYPPDFRGTVALDASKVYSATGTNGRVSFAYNPTQDAESLVAPADEPGDSPAPAASAAMDQDFEPPRSKVRASTKGAAMGNEKTLGRRRR